MSENVNKRVPITITLPESEYAAGDKLADGNLSAWIGRMIRSRVREKYGFDIDNPKPEDEAKIAQWVKDNTEKRSKHRKKGAKPKRKGE